MEAALGPSGVGGAAARPSEGLLSGASGMDPWTDRLWRSTLRRRMVGICGLAVAAVAIPAVGDLRVLISVTILVVGSLYHVGLQAAYVRNGRIPRSMAFTDVAVCLIFPIMSHTTFVPAMLVVVTVVSLAATTIGTRHALMATAMASLGMTAVVLVVRPEGPVLGVVSMTIASAMAASVIGLVAENELRSRVRFGTLIEGLDGIVWEGDPQTFDFTYVSPQAETVLGYPIEDWFEPTFWEDHLHPDDRERAMRICTAAEAEGRDHELEYRMIAADGRSVHLHDIVAVTVDQNLRPVSTHGVMIDITERVQAEQRVRQYADIVETIQIGLVLLHMEDPTDDLSFRLVAANPAACASVNRPLDQWTGRHLHEALPIVLESGLLQQIGDVIRTQQPFEVDEVVLRPGQTNEQVLAIRVFPLPGSSVGVSLDDITHASRASHALRQQALHDGLTGLPNRTLLHDRLRQALSEAARTQDQVALLVMDLDQFKEINDALGHHVGDLLLIELAQRLTHLAREADAIARLGGDEFAVLMTTDATEDGAVAMAARIITALLEPFELDDVRLQTNASIGIAVYPQHAEDAESLTQRADVAMYQAKRSGTGHTVYKAELDRSSVRRLTLLSELRRALDRDEFLLHYQPIIDVADGHPVRAEALVRWDHPEHGLIGPDDFIELAEVSGFIQPLTRWVLTRAITAAADWWRAGHQVGVAINLSVRNLYDPGLPQHVGELLVASGLPAGELMLEVTESELMDDPKLAFEVLSEVHRLGIATGVDDFGTGYSSLTYLRNLPIREIKIDRSFVSRMGDSPDDLTIVRSTIDLGHNLSLDVVAEGVEDADTLLRLGTLGCDLAQGYHLSRPLTVEAFHAWLEGQRRKAQGQVVPARADRRASVTPLT